MKTENFTFFFRENFIAIRKHNNLSQEKVAELLQINRKTVGAIEEGRTLGIESVYKVSRHFGYSIDDLITKEIEL